MIVRCYAPSPNYRLQLVCDVLQRRAIALDGLEAAIRVVELLLNDTNHSVGYGGSPDILGVTTLDAQMMYACCRQ